MALGPLVRCRRTHTEPALGVEPRELLALAEAIYAAFLTSESAVGAAGSTGAATATSSPMIHRSVSAACTGSCAFMIRMIAFESTFGF